MARRVLTGTLTLSPGTGQTATVRLPASYSQTLGLLDPDPIASSFTVSDPTNTTLFKVNRSNGVPIIDMTTSSDSEEQYFGVHIVNINYDLTGVNPVDVDFILVWADSTDPAYTYELDSVD